MEMRDLLRQLDLGNSVAEFDDSLERYFVETEPFRALVENRADVIAGDKGTGKTAMYRILRKRYAQLPELSSVEVITGFNPSGNPVFQRLAQQPVLTEGQYATIWKAYILSLHCCPTKSTEKGLIPESFATMEVQAKPLETKGGTRPWLHILPSCPSYSRSCRDANSRPRLGGTTEGVVCVR
jgi:hypothetical protein